MTDKKPATDAGNTALPAGKQTDEQDQTEQPIVTTNAELKVVVGEAVQAATTELAGQVQAAVEEKFAEVVQTEMAAQVAQVEEKVAAAKEEVQQAAIKAEETTTQAATAITAEIKVQVAETVEQAKAVIAEAVKEEVAAQTTAAPTATSAEIKGGYNGNHLVNSLIRYAKSQSRARIYQVAMALVIIGLSAYIALDKINDRRLADLAPRPSVATPSFLDLFNLDPLEPADYSEILRQQTNTLDQKGISDEQIAETVRKVLQHDKVSAVINANVESLKRGGLTDSVAIPQAFLAENVAPAVLAELPEEIKNFPQALEAVKNELARVSAYAEKELNKK